MGVIYLRTNTVNGMQYVGQTKNLEQRQRNWKDLNHIYAGPLIERARKKYGTDNWTLEILKECNSLEELNKWEQYYIKKFNTMKPNGYNMTEGGLVCEPWNKGKTFDELFDKEIADKLRKDISERQKLRTGKKNSFYGKHFVVHPMQNKHHSKETKQKIHNRLINHPNTSDEIVLVKDNGEIIYYTSKREAGRQGYDCGNVSKATRNVYHNGNHYRDGCWYNRENYEKMLAGLFC